MSKTLTRAPIDIPTPLTDAIRAACRGDTTELARELIPHANNLERHLATVTAARDAAQAGNMSLLKLIGNPPEGSHTDEWQPRGGTWHQERLNWADEVGRLRERLATVTAERDKAQKDAAELRAALYGLMGTARRISAGGIGGQTVDECLARERWMIQFNGAMRGVCLDLIGPREAAQAGGGR